MINQELKALFEAKFIVTPGCWEWAGVKWHDGYGRVGGGRKSKSAHRFSYEIYVGRTNGLHVLHRCDNRSCVNPDHLFLGTHADNMLDKTMKGRARGAHTGSDHHCSKLTPDLVLAIFEDPRLYREIANDFGVSRASVGDIKTGRTWATITKGGMAGSRMSAMERKGYLTRIADLERMVQALQLQVASNEN